jgi:hypothetical protein
MLALSKNTKTNDYELEEVDIERHLATALSNLEQALDIMNKISIFTKSYILGCRKEVLFPRMDTSDLLFTLAEQDLQFRTLRGKSTSSLG